MANQIYFVYVYHDPRDMQPFYVGKGKGNRHLFHIKEARDYREAAPVRYQNIPKITRIRNILETGREPVVTKVFYGSDDECIAEEVRLIATIGRGSDGPLLNQTDGGDGTSGFSHSEETKALFSRQRRGRAVTRHSEEWKQRLREDNAGGKATSATSLN